jgi:hypothetical protein
VRKSAEFAEIYGQPVDFIVRNSAELLRKSNPHTPTHTSARLTGGAGCVTEGMTRSAYLTPAQLLAQYEALAAKGCPIAAERVRLFRSKQEAGQ